MTEIVEAGGAWLRRRRRVFRIARTAYLVGIVCSLALSYFSSSVDVSAVAFFCTLGLVGIVEHLLFRCPVCGWPMTKRRIRVIGLSLDWNHFGLQRDCERCGLSFERYGDPPEPSSAADGRDGGVA